MKVFCSPNIFHHSARVTKKCVIAQAAWFLCIDVYVQLANERSVFWVCLKGAYCV